MAVVAHQYPYSIPSLADTLPDFPALVDLDIDHAIERGTPLDQANLDNARLAVRQLQVAFGTWTCSRELDSDLPSGWTT